MSKYDELARNICKELAIEPDAQVLVILTTAIEGAVDAALRGVSDGKQA